MCYNPGMATRTTLNISLTPHLQEFVDQRVASGRYQSASEVIRFCLEMRRILRITTHHSAIISVGPM